MKKLITIIFLTTAVACSGGGGGINVSADIATDVSTDVADVAGDSGADVVRDVAGDVIGDQGTEVSGDSVGEIAADATADAGDAADAVDAADAADVETDEGPQEPWYDRLAPEGQMVKEIFGVASHMDTTEAGDAETEWEFDQYQLLDGVRARRGFRWSNVEPNEGEFRWDKTNGAATRAIEHGVNLVPVVYYGNDWAQEDPEVYGTLDVSKYANYAGKMAEQYCASIKDYELWNEQNITRFWHEPPNPAKYAEMVVAASLAIKASCPDARVAFGGMASYDDVDMFDTWNFFRRSLEARPDLCEYFEIVAIHPYTFIQYDSPEYDEVDYDFQKPSQTRQTEIIREMLAAAGCTDKDIYFTELGWPSYDLTREQVANYAVRSMLLAARDSVEGWYWYTFYDDDPADVNPIRPHENYFGLWEYSGNDMTNFTPKPAWTALMRMLDAVGTGRFAGEISRMLDLPNDVYVLAFVDDEEDLVLAMWDARNQPDVTYGVSEAGGPATVYDLVLPLPEATVGTSLLNQAGIETSSTGAALSVQVQLTPEVQYLVIDRGSSI